MCFPDIKKWECYKSDDDDEDEIFRIHHFLLVYKNYSFNPGSYKRQKRPKCAVAIYGKLTCQKCRNIFLLCQKCRFNDVGDVIQGSSILSEM